MADAAMENESVGTLGQQAMAAVDNAETAPVDEVVESQVAQGSAQEGEQGAVEEDGVDLESLFADDPEPQEAAAEGEEDDVSEDEPEPKGRANKRIRALNSRLKETTGQYKQLNDYTHRLYKAYQSQLQQLNRLRSQKSVPPPAKKAVVDSDDPVEAFKQEILGGVEQMIASRLKEPTEKVNRIEQERRQALANMQRQQRIKSINQQVDAVVEEEIMPHVDGEIGQALKDDYARMVMVVQATEKKGFKQAAQKVRRMMTSHARGVVRKRTKANGTKVAASQSAPAPIPSGISGASGESFPSWEALRANNYRSYVQWQADGSPPLK